MPAAAVDAACLIDASSVRSSVIAAEAYCAERLKAHNEGNCSLMVKERGDDWVTKDLLPNVLGVFSNGCPEEVVTEYWYGYCNKEYMFFGKGGEAKATTG